MERPLGTRDTDDQVFIFVWNKKHWGKKSLPSQPPQTSRCEPTLQHHEQHLSKRAWDIRSITRRNIQLCQADTPGGQDSREGLVPAQLAQLCDLPDAAVPHGSHGSFPGVRAPAQGAARRCHLWPQGPAGTRPASHTGPSPPGKASGGRSCRRGPGPGAAHKRAVELQKLHVPALE